MARTDFAVLLEGFFLQWMGAGRQLSRQTISSYRDTFSLFLRWMRDSNGVDAASMTMDEFNADRVEAFMLHLTEDRGNSAATANCRLSALKAFCGYASYRAPERIAQLKRVKDLPRRAEKRSEVTYLTREEYGWLCDACDEADGNSAANHLMVTLLFSTGARISELVCLKAGDFSMSARKGQVRIFGKGRKERTLPLWPEVAEEVEQFMSARRLGADDYLFGGRNVPHLTRSGARSRIDAIVKRAQAAHPSLRGKKITPHVFRHSTAMGMLESGVDISTIAIWLGHENIQTTHRYMVTDMNRKEEALRKVHAVGAERKPQARYRASDDVLDFLMSL